MILNWSVIRNNLTLYITYLFLNIVIGNISILIYLDKTPIKYHIITTIFAILIHSYGYIQVFQKTTLQTKLKISLVCICMYLINLFFSCILISISLKLSTDTLISAILKGSSFIFIGAIIFCTPVGLLLFLWNYICLKHLIKLKKQIF